MLELLFSSRVRAKVLTTIVLSPGERRNAYELANSIGEHYSAIWRELAKLEKMGILSSQAFENSKEYQLNQNCPIVSELRSIVLKTEGIGLLLRSKLQEMKEIQKAFIFGSYASGDADHQSDIDLMIIGEVDLEQLSPMIDKMEKEINRPINYIIYTEDDWKDKAEKQDSFWKNVNESPKIYLIGNNDAI